MSSRLHGVCLALLEETPMPCYARGPAYISGKGAAAPLIPPTSVNWQKGHGREEERQGHGLPSLLPASPSVCPREQQQSCLCSAFNRKGRGSSLHPYQRACLSEKAPSKY